MRRAQIGMVALMFASLITAMFAVPGAAKDTPQQPQTLITDPSGIAQDPALSPPASPIDIEATIQGLRQPIDNEQLSQILFELGRLEDPQDQQRLQQMLDQRVQVLMATPAPTAQPAVAYPGTPSQPPQGLVNSDAVPDEDLLMRIEMLNLGPDASADDLRARDEVVSAIIGIADPIRRDRLLNRLGERERETDTAASRPTESSE